MFTQQLAAILLTLAFAQATPPQAPPAGGQKFTLSGNMLRGYAGVQKNLLEAAELMPEEHYTFKPTPDTRPFGQLVAHIALSQFAGCAALKGEPNPKLSEKEEAARPKTELVALLKASTAYCDPALNALTDAAMVELIKVGPNEAAKGLILASTNTHGNQLYGTMAVYLRLKGLVPPSTARQSATPAGPKKSDDPRTVIEEFFSAYRTQDVERFVAVLAPDVVFEDPTFRLRHEGVEAMRKVALDLRKTYRNVRVDVHSLTVEGDAVAAEVTIAGTLTRPDGTDRNLKVRGASFFRVRAGKIYKWTDYYDFRTYSEQVGTGQ
jgi:steroid delta-isomerase-like uncharacterized protein